ncbi:nuclear pore complex protein NUP1-like isoform X1 [Zingiber officinale]|uniref:nuclear pore complex protein NUP1-like isoform X1 n=1 Tax=Zingiber officinale TaxID=94328 RepID=UPI001C4B7934|nr:nuclear pore complex protein NUP1-like isoform X1 [Zingiber officinale]
MDEPGYGGGTGGKMRRKPLRRGAITPYDRPPASGRGVKDPPLETEERSWLGKFVVPASWFIANGASRLLSSVFRKRPPASPIQGFPVLGRRPESFFLDFYQDETSLSQSTQEVIGTISDDISAELPENKTNNQNVAANNPEDYAVLEFEQLIGQKSFTRAQYEHLMGILQSRIINSDTERSEANDAKNVVVPLPATTDCSRPHKDPVPDGHTVSPVELAKEYMNSKVSNASPFHLNWQKQLLHENKQGQSHITSAKKFDVSSSKPLILSHISAEIPDNSYYTPISAQRSAMHKMPKSPSVKGEGSSKDGYSGSLSLETSVTKQAVGQGQVMY